MKEEAKNPRAVSDSVLLRRARAGDLDAETEMLRRYKGLVKSKARAFFIVGADEDDVLQEGMIGLLNAVRKYDESRDASFKTFAGSCVANQIISAIRAAERNKHRILNQALSLEGSIAPGSGSPDGSSDLRLGDTVASNAETPEQLLLIGDICDYIEGKNEQIFSDYEREALAELRRGKSREQIAGDLGRSVQSVNNCLSRAKRKIVNYLVS